ncbi:MAG: sulfatase-like hydrolase/transferase [bacterium]
MSPERPNTILITADSLRADRLGVYGYHKPTTPSLDRFAAGSFLFRRAFTNGPNTPHAFPAILAARSALLSRKLGMFEVPVALAEILKESGYLTLAFNAANPYVSRFFHYDRGFDEFRDYLDFDLGASVSESQTDPSSYYSASESAIITIPGLDVERYLVTEASIKSKAQLEGQINFDIFEALQRVGERPFFLWIHYMDTHYPYLPQVGPQVELGMQPIPREENLGLNMRVRENMHLSEEMLHRVSSLYDAAIRQLDSKVGALLDFLKQLGLYDSAQIIFTADHGEEFAEHGDLQHKSKLYDELLHVPLLVKQPGQRRGETRQELVSLLQIAPTILSTLGLESPFMRPAVFEPEVGREICAAASFGPNGVVPVDANMFRIDRMPKVYGCRSSKWKLVFDTLQQRYLLFNLLADPNEKQDVYEAEKRRIAELQRKLDEYIVQLEKRRVRLEIERARPMFHFSQT